MQRIAVKFLMIIMALLITTACYQNIRSPGPTTGYTVFELDSDDYSIVGPVEAEGTIISILGLFNYGGQGFSELKKKALAKGADDVINVQTDLEVFGVLLVYNEFRWKATATAIRYRKYTEEEEVEKDGNNEEQNKTEPEKK